MTISLHYYAFQSYSTKIIIFNHILGVSIIGELIGSVFRLVTNKCNIRNWNYTQLGEMSYENASVYLQGMEMVDEVPCWSMESNRFAYDNDGLSIVPEVL